MIDLTDKTIDIIRSRRGHEQVWARIKQRNRAIRRWPRVLCQQFCYDRICRTAKSRNFSWVGNALDRIQTDALSLTFIIDEPERFIFNKRTARGKTKLVIVKAGLRIVCDP